MDTSNQNIPKIEVKYKDCLYTFYNKIDYDNWFYSIIDKRHVGESIYYKGLGTMNIYTKNNS